jgi:hypothetical protein
MTKLQEWLKEQGLAQYAGVLADNDIDFDVLSDLAESDLEKLGLSWTSPKALESARGTPAGNYTRNTKSGTTPGHGVVVRSSGFDGTG